MTSGKLLKRVRDLLYLEPHRYVVACDSLGGIGDKTADIYKTDGQTVGHFITRVPLLEVICAGADPVAIIATLSVERDPAGKPIIAAIEQIASELGAELLVSTEENVDTKSTGVGVTIIGQVKSSGFSPGGSHEKDVVVCVGRPRSAPQDKVTIGHPDLVQLEELKCLLDSGLVHDALPVGSRGLAWEGPELARTAGLKLVWREVPWSLTLSAGPSSCVLVSCEATAVNKLRSYFASSLPVNIVGDLLTK